MKIEVEEFKYTKEKALEDAKKYYEEKEYKEVIHKEFQHCQLSEIIAYVDEHNVEYSDVKVIAFTKPVDWEDFEESCLDVSFSVKMTGKELEIATRKFAKKLYKDSIEYYKVKADRQLQNQLNHILIKEI